MLNDSQINKVWRNMLEAEARALYFGDLTSRYTVRKQWITGISFFLSSGAAATLIAKSPLWVPTILSFIVAASTAYSIAVNLDRRILTMSKLYSSWNRISEEYWQLWNHTYAEDAEETLNAIIAMEREPSELATTNAPNDQDLLGKWEEHVVAMYRANQSA